ncbi:hypothetical protein PV11_09922 [Exophiala sideris]|uniref:Zn(2)-C6 fungal-type domain-containing protein n=1 Tax=Exophiala sideris TaxID=1016849 RepID=A0A0D1YBI8_9EURO|nr:hypothetical protein PV11_09922 [Exophiala sideris]
MDNHHGHRETLSRTAGYMPSPKRQKRQDSDDAQAETGLVRQSKACSSCRKLKVKCDPADDRNGVCSRCRRLNLHCLREKRLWASTDDTTLQLQLTITKLERALEDVLEKLDMPALDLYVSPDIVEPIHPPRPTRQNSEEPQNERYNVSSEPMNSLIEATNLKGLRSELRSAKQRRKGGMRRMDSDLISEKIITLEEGESLLTLFKEKQGHHLFSANIPDESTLESIRTSSTVLFTAVILVAALHVPGKETLHEKCYNRFLGLVASVIFDRFHTLDDIRGLCIAAFWQPYLSWKLSGLSIRMAAELNLHHAFYEAFNEANPTAEARKENLERARLWYLLYVLDHQSSITYGRPSVMSELRPIKDYEMLLDSEFCTSADRSLIAQVTGLVVLSRAFDHFGLEPKRAMAGDDISVLNHMRFIADIQSWKDKWVKLREAEKQQTGYSLRGIDLHYYFSNLVLNSLVLRGRSLDSISDLPASLRPSALKAVEAAHSILQHFLTSSKYREQVVGMPLYLHSMIAFAVVFLLKMSPRWHTIGITINSQERTLPLVEDVIGLLRGCEAGANHIIYSMANGFERMLRQIRRNGPTAQIATGTGSGIDAGQSQWLNNQPVGQNGLDAASNTINLEYDFGDGPMLAPANELHANYGSPYQPSSQINWGFQDGELWSVGMGYDLLEPGGQGLASTDFPFQFSM